VNDPHRFRVVCCGRRFGKTTLSVLELIGKAISKDDIQVAYLSTTHQQSKDIAWLMLKRLGYGAVQRANETRLDMTLKTVGGGTSTIWLRGWESVETLRGQYFDFIVIDEIASMRNWRYNWQEVIRPTLTDKQGGVLFISTPKGFNHFYDLFNMEFSDEDFKSFKFTTYDNPHIPPKEIEVAKRQMTEDAFQQEYMAEFRTYSGLVYKDWNREVHLIAPVELDDMTHYRYIDFGYSNPSAVGFIAVDFDNNWYIYDEIYKKYLTTPELFEIIKQKSGTQYFTETFGDSMAAGDIEQLERMGLSVTPVSKSSLGSTDNYNMLKHKLVREKLKIQEGTGKPKLFVFKGCKHHIREFESYALKEPSGDENFKEEAIKKNDHLMDGLGYFATSVYNPSVKNHKLKYNG
jgi:hypothetical protein